MLLSLLDAYALSETHIHRAKCDVKMVGVGVKSAESWS